MGVMRPMEGSVTVYDYRCPAHGDFEQRFPMGEAPAAARCGTCGGKASRVYGPTAVLSHDPLATKLLALQQSSAESPSVVTRSRTAAGRRAPTQDPRWRQLPRP
ncbi:MULTISPECIES: zinc ribbon domain-containing protein [Gordonia]|uniref:zinc ribbon domain-containing protein n=1 Tax=Gordonia TaxID=2053 RepID=UPI000A03236E